MRWLVKNVGVKTMCRGRNFLILMALVAMAVAGCQADKSKTAAVVQQNKPAIIKKYAKKPIKLELHLDSDRINTAQFFHLLLRVEGPENYTFELPAADDEVFGDLTVAGGKKTKPALNAKGIYQQQSYILEPLGPGKTKLPPLHVSAWEKGKDKAQVIELVTDEIPLTVESLLVAGDKAKLADIVPPVAEPVNWLLWSGVAAGVMVLLAVIWFLWGRRKPKEAPLPPAIPPYLAALRAIEDLRNKKLPAMGMTKQFYAELSNILRQYIERHLGLRATEQTTEEFLVGLGSLLPHSLISVTNKSGSGLRAEHKRLLRDFLTHCDLVKFAEYQPHLDDIDSALTLCRKFIEDTGGEGPVPDDGASSPAPAPKSLELKR